MKKNIIIFILIVIVVAAGAFFGGMQVNRNNNPRGLGQQIPDNLRQNGVKTGTSMINGEVIAKDDQSITVKIQNGGSKIVLYSDSTEVSKFASGNIDDLVIGKNVMINGSGNQDGSVTAKTIQIRPEVIINK